MTSGEYDPSDVGVKGSLFGFPYEQQEAEIIILGVPWEVTASYGGGTSEAPDIVLDASTQLDFEIVGIEEPWRLKSVFSGELAQLGALSKRLKTDAGTAIRLLEEGREVPEAIYQSVNPGCGKMMEEVEQKASAILESGKIVAVLGGDHSTPLGLLRALAMRQSFGILQIDAHMDLREAYEGFTYSHASIMRHAIQLNGVQSITQVGIRDFSQEEIRFANAHKKKVKVWFDDLIQDRLINGTHWSGIAREIIQDLPEKVYVSFDIDGLDPSLCPATGTPVPGGLSLARVNFLLDTLVRSGRQIIGFDLCEVGNHPWDGNVGARVLYRLCTYTGLSRKLISFQ